ncbi:MAG: FxsA family protein [Myxococcota bacterium]|nr:FxsA family protein [Myxococcota bacterium]
MGRLLLLFVVLPAVELGLLIEVGGLIGTPATLGLIVVTGVVGASLARRQGLGVISQIQRETAEGRMPAGTVVDGVIILLAGALLVTPGILTDAFGFLCLVPAFRRLLKREAIRRLERAVREGRVQVQVYGEGAFSTDGFPREEKEVRDVRDTRPPIE